MKPELRRALWFALQFAVLFPAFVQLYPSVLPGYQDLVLGIADAVGRGLGWLRVTFDAEAERIVFRFADGVTLRTRIATEHVLDAVYLSLALLPALLLATPMRLGARLRLLGLGLLLLLACHVLTTLGLASSLRCVALRDQGLSCRFVAQNVKIGGQVSAALLWALLTWRYWLAPAEQQDPGASQPALRR